jgi:hypothetical protein
VRSAKVFPDCADKSNVSNLKFAEQRLENRLLCADIVEVHWVDRAGRPRQSRAVLEDVSPSGLCLQFETPVPRDTRVRIVSRRAEFSGSVRYCVHQAIGYFVGVKFDPGLKWARKRFLPRHLFDPRRLAGVPQPAVRPNLASDSS